MNFQGEAVELKKKVFAPTENIFDDLSLKANFLIEVLPDGTENNLFPKRFELLFREK